MIPRSHAAAAAMLALGTAAASAQAPVITPAGDPSVRSDTIYALAVDPADHPEEMTVLLLDDGVVRIESDGTGVRTYRYVTQLLKPDAVENWGELTFSYNPDRERFRLNWVRVLDTKGAVISEKPLHVQESDVPAPEGSPVFTNQKRVRVSLSGVAANTIVDYSYTTETFDPVLAGDFWGSWFFNPGATIRRSRLILDLPEAFPARLHPVDLNFEPVVQRVGGRIVRDWSLQEIPRVIMEPFAPDSNGVSMHVAYAGALEWQDIGSWYRVLAADRYALTGDLEARLAALVAGSHTLADSLRAVHRWVAQDVRYVSLSLGIGGYQPRPAADVLASLSGDCKDKTTLFVALARRMGVQAWPVLTSSSGIDTSLPSLRQFDHAIAVVELPAGERVYTDLTASLVPFTELPGNLHGGHGLIVYDDRPAELIRFDDPPATESAHYLRVAGALSADGVFTGRYEETSTGFLQYKLRDAFYAAPNDRMRSQIAQNIAGSLFSGARGDSLTVFDGRDLEAKAHVTVRVHAPRATSTTPAGDHVFTLPLAPLGNANMLHYFEGLEERRMPIHIGSISGDYSIIQELEVSLPGGWTAQLPAGVRTSSRFGSLTSTYTLDGSTLRVRREYVGGRGIAGPETLPELIAWLGDMDRDDVRFIVLRPK